MRLLKLTLKRLIDSNLFLVLVVLVQGFVILLSNFKPSLTIFANSNFNGLLDYSDINVVWKQYAIWMLHGLLPYLQFNVDLPPGFLIYLLIPTILWRTFGFEFSLWVSLGSLTWNILTIRELQHLKKQLQPGKMKFYNQNLINSMILSLGFYPPIVFQILSRIDVLLLFLLVKSLSELLSNRRLVRITYFLTLGFSIKYVTGLVLALLIVYLLIYSKTNRAKVRILFDSLIGCIFTFVSLVIFSSLILRTYDPFRLLMFNLIGFKDSIEYFLLKPTLNNSIAYWISQIINFDPSRIFVVIQILVIIVPPLILGLNTKSKSFSRTTITVPKLIHLITIQVLLLILINKQITPQYFLYPMILCVPTGNRKIFILSFLLYTIAFAIQTVVNVLYYTHPNFIPTLL